MEPFTLFSFNYLPNLMKLLRVKFHSQNLLIIGNGQFVNPGPGMGLGNLFYTKYE
jgi:hypothetical protein